jgi:hypothetical protein
MTWHPLTGLKWHVLDLTLFFKASASPFEGLAERMNWLNVKPEEVCLAYTARKIEFKIIPYDMSIV